MIKSGSKTVVTVLLIILKLLVPLKQVILVVWENVKFAMSNSNETLSQVKIDFIVDLDFWTKFNGIKLRFW